MSRAKVWFPAVTPSCHSVSYTESLSPGSHLEGKTTPVPLRKPHGAAVVPLHDILASGLSGDQEEKDIQMDVFVYVSSFTCMYYAKVIVTIHL